MDYSGLDYLEEKLEELLSKEYKVPRSNNKPCSCGVKTEVIETRHSTDKSVRGVIVRTRQCLACGSRWTTTEMPNNSYKEMYEELVKLRRLAKSVGTALIKL